MMQIAVAMMEFCDAGRSIWIHDNEGSTVLRIQCTGKVKLHYGCTNICPHSDINVVGDIEICIPDALKPEPEPEDVVP